MMVEPDKIEQKPIVVTPVEGRQGFLGRPVLAVLIVSTLLAVIAMYFAGFVRF